MVGLPSRLSVGSSRIVFTKGARCAIRVNVPSGTSFSSFSSGGGLFNYGTATLTNCTVSGNSAQAAIGASGGGVFNSGTATLANCTVSDNSATAGGVFPGSSGSGSGGGLVNSGTATLANCTVSGNSATGDGGRGDSSGSGSGGGLVNSGTATLTNCTVSGNSATGDGGYGSSGGSGSGSGSGGGISGSGFTVANTIIAGNTASATGANPTEDGPDAFGTVTSLGHNLIGKTDGSSGWVASDLTGTVASPLDPLLAPLGNYGGPTQTMALLPGSPAIDAGAAVALSTLSANAAAGATTLSVRNATPFAPGMMVQLARTGSGAEVVTIAAVNYSSNTLTLQAATLDPHGSSAGLFLATDQRGDPRIIGAAADIGAFESSGFTIAFSGDNQSTAFNTAFANPLVVQVTANNSLEPVAGGVVTYTGPSSGAGLTPATGTAVIAANGQASLTATANGSPGAYTVTASAKGASGTATFHLSNGVLATISGVVFEDVNANSRFAANDPGIGVTIQLEDASGHVLETTTTSGGGNYVFANLAPGTYQIHEIQPTGVTQGPAVLGSVGGSVVNNSTMKVLLTGVNATGYNFTQLGQAIRADDSASVSFWESKSGQALITSGGTALANWLTANFGNVFGNTFVGKDGAFVASFYKNQLYGEKHLFGPASPDTEFMATALSVYFSSSDLAGNLAVGSGIRVTDTGLGTDLVNVLFLGSAFGTSNFSTMSVMQWLQAANAQTTPSTSRGFDPIYSNNGQINFKEALLRLEADVLFALITEVYS